MLMLATLMSTLAQRNVRAVILMTALAISASCSAKPKTDDVIPSKQEPVTQAALVNEDSTYTAIIAQAKAQKIQSRPIGERVVAMGKFFLGVPYVSGTLDQDTTNEDLVVNLHGLDCV